MKNLLLKKAILFSFCLLTSAFLLHAQAPQGIPYQAIARNASGVAIANTAVKVRFSIRDSIATGPVRYQETHNPTTSALGLFSVNVGMGTVASGTFSGINWGKNAKFLRVELNTTGGTTFTDLGTTQMMSVPYAMYSDNAGNGGFTNMKVFDQPGNFTWTAPPNVRKVKVECWGAGGAGISTCYSCGSFRINGASGAYGMGIYDILPNNTYPVLVGAGGISYTHPFPYTTITTLDVISTAIGGTSSFGNFIQSSGGSFYINGGISPKGGTSNGIFNIDGSPGTNDVTGTSFAVFKAGDAPMGGSGAGNSLQNGNNPGGGGTHGYSIGGSGRVLLWW